MKHSAHIFACISLIFIPFSCFPQNRPNIVFIMADDLGARDLPVYGNTFNEAPNIEKLASQGMRFSNAYAAPVCSPARASIQSGQYPARVGIIDFIPGHWRPFEEVTVPVNKVQHLPDEIFTIGDALQTAGYKTGYFGKWHLGNDASHLPGAHGYDESFTYAGGGYYNPKFYPAYNVKEKKRVNNILTDMAIDFIRKYRDGPFFLFVSHCDVHVQLDADREIITKYLDKEKQPDYPCNAVYAAMIEQLDKGIGDLMKAVDEMGLTDNTLFIFFSDNGAVDKRYDNIPLLESSSLDVYPEGHPLRYIATTNAPLRAGKGTLYEGGVRVPLIVKWPGHVKPASRSDAVVSCVDFYPTFIELANGEKVDNQVLDGFSMLPVLTKNKYDPEREVYTHYPVYHHDLPRSAVRKGDWKIVENLVSGAFELYNLKYDPGERTDLRFSYPEKFEEMKSVLKKWQKDTGSRMPVPNPGFDASRRYEWGKHPDRN